MARKRQRRKRYGKRGRSIGHQLRNVKRAVYSADNVQAFPYNDYYKNTKHHPESKHYRKRLSYLDKQKAEKLILERQQAENSGQPPRKLTKRQREILEDYIETESPTEPQDQMTLYDRAQTWLTTTALDAQTMGASAIGTGLGDAAYGYAQGDRLAMGRGITGATAGAIAGGYINQNQLAWGRRVASNYAHNEIATPGNRFLNLATAVYQATVTPDYSYGENLRHPNAQPPQNNP